MNIFALDKSPEVSAEMACDKHVVKMILESAQMLCAVQRVQDGVMYHGKSANGRKIKRWRHPNTMMEQTLYKAGWINHLSTQWVMKSAYNYNWLYRHFIALNEEFKKRFKGVDHTSVVKLKEVLRNPPKNSPLNVVGTLPTPAMPDECKVPGDVVGSYRKYYIMKKRDFATWKEPSKVPEWYSQAIGESI